MRKLLAIVCIICALATLELGFAHDLDPAPSSPPADAPELARLGSYPVGTTVSEVALPPRGQLSVASFATGKLDVGERTLEVRLWYPAGEVGDQSPVRYEHDMKQPSEAPDLHFVTPGIAFADAPPAQDGRFPLILMSHGFAGWGTSMSNLGENLASKGYVVASIDHDDLQQKDAEGMTPQIIFGIAVLNRASDQRAVLAWLLAQADNSNGGYASLIDPDRVGVLGYSMGGYGALATAGASYDPGSSIMKLLPADAQGLLQTDQPDVSASIKAVVAIAPWGGQPATRAWTAQSLGNIGAPVLLMAGDHDDIVDYDAGVRWIYDNLTNTTRRLLVYLNARHNVANNPMPDAIVARIGDNFTSVEYFAEPVWRTERINAINQHFITAFLDHRLKADAAKAAYLDVPTQASNDGKWPVSLFGPRPEGGATASEKQSDYWRGFQRRWALGLELHCRAPGGAEC